MQDKVKSRGDDQNISKFTFSASQHRGYGKLNKQITKKT